MFCRNGSGSVLRKGIAAFLLLILTSSMAFADETVRQPETTEGENLGMIQENGSIAAEEEIEKTESVKVAVNDDETSDTMEKIDEGGMVLFAQSNASSTTTKATAAANKTVKLFHTKKIKYESYFTHDFTVKCDGKNIPAYCIEPDVRWGGEKNYTAKPYNASLMRKALYYSYGNPGYSQKTSAYLAKVSRKACYKGKDGVYALCHIMLSYVYDGKKTGGGAFKGCSSATKTVVKNFVKAIESWPDPPGSDIGLSVNSVKAEWNEETMMQETPEITVTGSKGNTIAVPVPDGASVVKNGECTGEGRVTVAVGESFSLAASAEVRGSYKSPEIAGSVKQFQPYLIAPKGKQSQVFSVSTSNYVSYSVKWEDFGKIKLAKTSSDESITSENAYYSLNGAEYAIFNAETDKCYGILITDEDGIALSDSLPYGEYYITEQEAPRGYTKDTEIHRITVEVPQRQVDVQEVPIRPELSTRASEKNSGRDSFTECGETTIVDTVEYRRLEPGCEYRITGRLVDKETGEDLPGTEEEEIFTPESENGSINMQYDINSSGMGGKTVVAFEKLYFGDDIIAIHENINDEAQSVDILTPQEAVIRSSSDTAKPAGPEERTAKPAPETGDEIIFMLLLLIMGMTVISCAAVVFVKSRQ